MGDPFSIFTGALTVGDVCLQVGKYVRTVVKAAGEINHERDSLGPEIDRFTGIYDALRKVCPSSEELHIKQHDDPDDLTFKLWDHSRTIVEDGDKLVKELEKVLFEVAGGDRILHSMSEEQSVNKMRDKIQRKFDDFKRAAKKLPKEKQLDIIRQRMTSVNQQLSTMLIAINTTSSTLRHMETYDSIKELPGKISKEIQKQNLQLKMHIDAFQQDSQTGYEEIVA